MVSKFRVWFSCLLLLIFATNAMALEVTATIDKNPVMLDEAFTLTVTATGNVDRNTFTSDFLLKDFVVGNTSVSSQTKMINFDTTRSTTWTTTLFPKKDGQFTIPAIDINGSKTQPITVKVIPVPTATTQEQRDFFVTAELAATTTYVQEHINYTVKLHMAGNIERGSLQGPQMENARIEQVGDDKQYSDIINGKRFQIVERNFVIIPEQSGEYTIQGPIFSGEVLANNSRQSFSFFNRTQNISRRGPQLTLRVKPIPNEVDGHWLPSQFVDLTESWPEDKSFVVGEPITRTLTLTVAGQTEEQLPQIEQIYPPTVKTYPDQAETVSAEKDGLLVAQRIESTAIIPTEEGQLVLPGAEVSWFNTRTQKMEVAKVPAKTVMVLPSTNNIPASPPATEMPIIQPNDVASTDTNMPVNIANIAGQTSSQPLMWMVFTFLFAILWLISTFLWLRKPSNPPQILNHKPQQNSVSTTQLIKAIKQSDSIVINKLLLTWLRAYLCKPTVSLHEALSHPQCLAINEHYQLMAKHKLSDQPCNYSADEFIKVIRTIDKSRNSNNTTGDTNLAPLYPST